MAWGEWFDELLYIPVVKIVIAYNQLYDLVIISVSITLVIC